jgi:predicted dehydrogenase
LHWRQDVARSGVNTMSLGIWYEALMRWIGEAESVSAQGFVAVAQRRDAETGTLTPVRVPEYLVATAAMACGAQATFLFSTVTGGVKANEALLFGTEGTLRFADGQLYGQRRGERALAEFAIPAAEAIGWRVEEEFVDAIRGHGKVERTTFADGLKYMAFTEAVVRSLAEHRTVPIGD